MKLIIEIKTVVIDQADIWKRESYTSNGMYDVGDQFNLMIVNNQFIAAVPKDEFLSIASEYKEPEPTGISPDTLLKAISIAQHPTLIKDIL